MSGSERRAGPLRASLVVAAVVWIGTAAAQNNVANFDIDEQPLANGLLDYGRQASVSIAAPEAVTAGRRSRAVHGRLTQRQALEQLLQGTGVSFSFATPNSIRVFEREGEGVH
jgi:hypothetical protein